MSNGTSIGTSASQIFWEKKVLDISDGIENLGGVKYDLAIALAISWIIVLACLVKGVKTSGKVVYFAATFPYVILLTLLVVGLKQEGSWDGIKFFITPKWDKLLEMNVWKDAATQMFYSLGVAGGSLVMFSSYNSFNHNVYRDALIVSAMDTLTSIIAGFVIFSVIGALKHELAVEDITKVIADGPGLAFVVYPEALSRISYWPNLWSVLFFFMFYLLGLDSQFAMFETIVSSISDEIPYLRKHRLKFTTCLAIIFFLCGLSCLTRGGQFVFQILDNYGGGVPYMFLAVFEVVGIMWIYGCNNFTFDVNYMLKRKMGFYWKLTWKYTAPIVITFIIIASFIQYQPLSYGNYKYPQWADSLGWFLTCSILIPIPLWALYCVTFGTKGNSLTEKVTISCRDTDDWGPSDEKNRKEWRGQKDEKYIDNVTIFAREQSVELEDGTFSYVSQTRI